MDFGAAVKMLKAGSKLTRTDWMNNERIVYIRGIALFVRTDNLERLYTPTNNDILATDWEFPR